MTNTYVGATHSLTIDTAGDFTQAGDILFKAKGNSAGQSTPHINNQINANSVRFEIEGNTTLQDTHTYTESSKTESVCPISSRTDCVPEASSTRSSRSSRSLLSASCAFNSACNAIRSSFNSKLFNIDYISRIYHRMKQGVRETGLTPASLQCKHLPSLSMPLSETQETRSQVVQFLRGNGFVVREQEICRASFYPVKLWSGVS
jgi:hypothetical protein